MLSFLVILSVFILLYSFFGLLSVCGVILVDSRESTKRMEYNEFINPSCLERELHYIYELDAGRHVMVFIGWPIFLLCVLVYYSGYLLILCVQKYFEGILFFLMTVLNSIGLALKKKQG